MTSRKRNLEKVERVVNSVTTDVPTEAHGEAAKYLRNLIAKAERGELPKVKPATDEKRSETWLEAEVKTIAQRLRHHTYTRRATEAVRDGRAQPEGPSTGADDEPPDELLAMLLAKTGLASDKVH